MNEEAFVNAIYSNSFNNIHVITLQTTDHTEFFFNTVREEGDTLSSLLTRLSEVVRNSGAKMVSLDVFGGLGSGAKCNELVSGIFRDMLFPVTWIEEKLGPATHIAGAQAWGVSGAQPLPLVFEGSVLGSYFDTSDFRYCRLGG